MTFPKLNEGGEKKKKSSPKRSMSAGKTRKSGRKKGETKVRNPRKKEDFLSLVVKSRKGKGGGERKRGGWNPLNGV